MLRNVIVGTQGTEIYKIGAEMKRGSVVTKNYTTKVAGKASGEGVQFYFLDADNQPMGHLSDVELSAYTNEMDTVKANALGILIKPSVGSHWATDQFVATGFSEGDYGIAGTAANAGLIVKASSDDVSTLKYVGEYLDGDKVLAQFEVIYPHTVA